jgi:hypothetical protein
MPFKIFKFNDGYRVGTISHSHFFSHKPLTLKQAKKQLTAIRLHYYNLINRTH